MESQFLRSFSGVLDFCYKDQHTVFVLKKQEQINPNGLQIVEIMEIDLIYQTIRRQVEIPLFEGSGNDDGRFNILNGGQERVLVVYPSNTIVSYDPDSLEVLSVVQSAYNIVCPVILDVSNLQPLSFM